MTPKPLSALFHVGLDFLVLAKRQAQRNCSTSTAGLLSQATSLLALRHGGYPYLKRPEAGLIRGHAGRGELNFRAIYPVRALGYGNRRLSDRIKALPSTLR